MPRAKPTGPRTCRLTLTIRGVDYLVRPVAPPPPGSDRAWRLSRPGGVAYVVASGPTGTSCSCPGAVWQPPCKHALAVAAVGLLPAAPALPPLTA